MFFAPDVNYQLSQAEARAECQVCRARTARKSDGYGLDRLLALLQGPAAERTNVATAVQQSHALRAVF